MKINVRGDHFTAYLDGQMDAAASDAAKARGCVGFEAWEPVCRFRNVKVNAPNGKTLWEGLPKLPMSESIGVSLPRAIDRN